MNNIKNEIKKSLFNIYFILPCFLGIVLSLIYAFKAIDIYSEYCKHVSFDEVLTQNTLAPTFNAFMIWIGGPRLEDDKSTIIFFWYVILAAAVPYTWSYCAERRKAKKLQKTYSVGIKQRIDKYISVFISSGLISAVSLLINLAVILLFIPATKPDPVYNIYYREFSSSLTGEIYYSFPIVYEIIYIAFFFAFCGLIGCVGYSVSLIIKNEIAAVLSPVILILAIHFSKNRLYSTYKLFSPFEYMNVADRIFRNSKIMLMEMLIMFLLSFSIVLIMFPKKKKHTIMSKSMEVDA
ncbi:hypothetical protein [Ruminococcus flavefaciens]|uniref:hypothetical protein n=1 Tax=Ruminococcus flavefaciens TaxID=1265 RepID=UPI0026F27217|nr:hypothetical protein [Ruminococcus flavefaciens]